MERETFPSAGERGRIQLDLPPPRLAVRSEVGVPSASAEPVAELLAGAPVSDVLQAPSQDDRDLIARFQIEALPDGRFRCRGYEFHTLELALGYARRLRGEFMPADATKETPSGGSHPPTPPPASAIASPKVGEEDRAVMEALGIFLSQDRYVCGGYAFATLDQAADFGRRQAAPLAADWRGVGAVAPAAPVFESVPPQASAPTPPTDRASPPKDWLSQPGSWASPRFSGANGTDANLMTEHGVALVEGRYVVGGHGFSNLLQAVDHARRRSGAGNAVPGSTESSGRPAWIKRDQPVRIAQVEVAGGLIYVGRPTGSGAWTRDRSLIDPTLRIGLSGTDPLGAELSYWSSYREMSLGGRRTYLDWLARGRTGAIGTGYVLIFFYGLERRLFVDKAFDEAGTMAEEVRRLMRCYDQDYAFVGHATRFLEAADLLSADDIVRPLLSPVTQYMAFEIPLPIRRYLGARLSEGAPFDAHDSLLWVLSSPESYLRTPGTRCFEELKTLWEIRFAGRYPDGLKVRAPKRRLSGVYRAASGAFQVDIALGDLPDIAAVAAPLAPLRELLSECQDDLDAFSRLLGRRPEARGTLEAAFCLPRDMFDTPFASGVRAAKAAVVALLEERTMAPVPLRTLCGLIGIPGGEGKAPVGVQRQIGATLDRLDMAFEPDRRYGDASPVWDGEVMIYRAVGGAPTEHERPAYRAARTMVEIAALAAASDGEIVPAEVEQIQADLSAVPELSEGDRVRLSVFGLWLMRDPPRQQAALTKLAGMTAEIRSGATRAAISAVLADGRVAPAEVKFLEKLYKALGLPQDDVYASLHRGAVRIDAPVTVAPAEDEAGVAIPREARADGGVLFDPARLARIQQETSAVSSLLAGIFADAEPEPPIVTTDVPIGLSLFFGLDGRHADLLSAVLKSGTIDRAAFDDQARSLKLLPDGAVETINDWAFDHFDEPLLEGDDALTVVAHLRPSLAAMELSA
tara:strand:+ start:12170 stop:15088 length:2919 start_codon:yes stop_codon:yes gene_type:complete